MKQMKESRKAMGLTQEQLAERAEVSQGMIAAIEIGKRKPSVKIAKRIASVLGFPWTDFFPESA